MLRVSGKELRCIFTLLGEDENSATFALGWVLSRCEPLLQRFVKDICGDAAVPLSIAVDLQRHNASANDGGYTDIEILCSGGPHIIIEAKSGWVIPTKTQLKKYVGRISAKHPNNRIISISAASQQYAASRLPKHINGTDVTHRSWHEVRHLSDLALKSTRSPAQRIWLSELSAHLRGYETMRNVRDNQVYVVSLSDEPFRRKGRKYTSIDVVQSDRRYFHPVGNRWPVTPPNYIGFRFDGILHSIHYIESYEVVLNLASKNGLWPTTKSDHFVYKLGPPIRPPKEVRSGKIRNRRVWCAIDTLVTGRAKTVEKAASITKRRLQEFAV